MRTPRSPSGPPPAETSAPTTASDKLRRNRELAAIHAAKKQLDLDDATYRNLLENLTRKRSAAKLTAAERRTVIEWFRRNGFQRPAGRRLGAEAAKQAARLRDRSGSSQEDFILGLWDQLTRLGAFEHGIHARLDTWLARQGFAVSHPRFLKPRQAQLVIEALKAWVARVKRNKGLD